MSYLSALRHSTFHFLSRASAQALTKASRFSLCSARFYSTASKMVPAPKPTSVPKNSDTFIDYIAHRHSVYTLTDKSPISDERLKKIINDIMLTVPSSFNNQTTRLVVLLRDDHKKFWDDVDEALEPHLRTEDIKKNSMARTAGFRAAYGTILCLEDPKPIKEFQEKLPSFASNFPEWAEHSSGMHHFALWTALEAEGFGASLQHYTNIVDEKASSRYKYPSEWRLRANLVFGALAEGTAWPEAKDKLDTNETVHWHG